MELQEIIKRIKSATSEGDWQEVFILWRLTETQFGVSDETIEVHEALGQTGISGLLNHLVEVEMNKRGMK